MAETRTRTLRPEFHKHLLDRNFSDRNGAPIQAIAIHSTESSDKMKSWDDIHGVRGWFNNPDSRASSHLGIDGDGNVEQWVDETLKAWTILQLNPVTLNIEFIGRAAQPKAEWEEAQVKAGARWVAYWSQRFDIPIQRGVVKNINGFPVITRKGIITHKQLTDAGFGSHTDPGPNFPTYRFIESARWYLENGWIPNETEAPHAGQ